MPMILYNLVMLSIFNKIKSCKNLTDNEKVLASFILKKPELLISMNAKQLADLCYVSQATVYRLCDKLDLDGFADLKINISRSLKDYKTKKDDDFDYHFPVKENSTTYDIVYKIKEDYDKTIETTSDLLSIETLKKVAKELDKAEYIDVYTSAGNIYFAQSFQFQMQEIGRSINVPVDSYAQQLQASLSNEKHFAIVISFLGQTQSSREVMQILNHNKTKTLLICSPDFVFKKEKPDYVLNIAPNETNYIRISNYATRISILYILDVLYTCYFELDYKRNLEKRVVSHDILAKARNNS